MLRVRLVTSKNRTGTIWDEVRPVGLEDDPLDDDAHARATVEAVRRLLVSAAELRDEDVVASRYRRQSSAHQTDFTEKFSFHFDYGQFAYAHYSAIIYTGNDDDEPLVGGRTAFVDTPPPPALAAAGGDESASDRGDEAAHDTAGMAPVDAGLERLPNGTAHLRRGLVVAPRVGRLILFTGGSENYHAPLPVAQGRRRSIVAWFRCAC